VISDHPGWYTQVAETMCTGSKLPGDGRPWVAAHCCGGCRWSAQLESQGTDRSRGITVRCDGCGAYRIHDALEAGASRKEIAETVGVAELMGGPSVVCGCQALEALEEFEEAGG
jgi:hypothetical protein